GRGDRGAARGGAEDGRVRAARADRRRHLRQQGGQGLVDAVLRRGVVADARQDVRLVLEGDRDRFVDRDGALRQGFSGDRGDRRGRRGRRRGLRADVEGAAEDHEENGDEDPSHAHAPSFCCWLWLMLASKIARRLTNARPPPFTWMTIFLYRFLYH